ncbi:serine protease [Mycobacterium sp. ACS1612]|uniref:S1C family serine protease n=1 Tax=Mycobacterium sp. ACS1612 TaxID=1834117 RepID=UPI00080168DC|nr:trypsin-like peptidase domain-containing protein [Mycobacterium sp. ACS1612]OBF39637.1 serine protease [Mycobacterium sp. ACS1612]
MRILPWRRPVAALLAVLAVVAALVAPATAAAAPVDITAAAAAVEPAVVQITTKIDYQQAIGTGTGMVIDPGGVVLTNYHVVAGANTITGTVGGRDYPVDLVGYDRKNDIAVLQLRGAGGLPTAPIGDSAQIVVGEPTVGLGNARGVGAPLTHETGPVTALNQTVNAEDALTGSSEEVSGLIEVAADVRPGDSGGPLVNGAGQVIGVVTAASVNYQMGPAGKGFAIPVNNAMAIAGQIRSGAPSPSVHIGQPTLLGVGVGSQPRRGGGIIVRDVMIGGPAGQAGLAIGDVLTNIDGVELDSATTLTYVLDRHYPGDVVDLTWIDRSGQQRTGKATLVSGP